MKHQATYSRCLEEEDDDEDVLNVGESLEQLMTPSPAILKAYDEASGLVTSTPASMGLEERTARMNTGLDEVL
jgi:hypothetical protein